MPKRAPSNLDTTGLGRLLRKQDGVVAWSQLARDDTGPWVCGVC